jgi:hypothetical protein
MERVVSTIFHLHIFITFFIAKTLYNHRLGGFALGLCTLVRFDITSIFREYEALFQGFTSE